MKEMSFAEMKQNLKLRLGRYRYAQFVEKLRWKLPGCSHRYRCEWDEYDSEKAIFVLLFNDRHILAGCSRLLPTTTPYLLEGVFSHTCTVPLPRATDVWEMTRFVTSEPHMGMPLFWHCLEVARGKGADSVIGVINRAMERYYRRNGVHIERLGPVTDYLGEPIVPIRLPTAPESHRRMELPRECAS